ncbi:MAG: NAD-dependent epimerase/dehydratase family protein, partial [Henriciella sp.]
MLYLVTGVAGFIGSQTAMSLLARGHQIIGVDNLNDYYSVALKKRRLEALVAKPGFKFVDLDIANHEALLALAERPLIDRVIHLAAQAGVRYSIEKPFAYASSNLTGHLSVLEFCRHAERKPLLAYASSSSVYGEGLEAPFSEDAMVDKPVSLYAATKRADELMSLTYAKLYGLQQIAMRFFTVFGPWGRPDMAYWSFTDRILRGQPIRVFNQGNMRRDFTYIDDVVQGVTAIAEQVPNLSGLDRPHRIYNIGNNKPVRLLDFIRYIEDAVGQTAKLIMEPMQPGDVPDTCADISRMKADYGYAPQTSLADGIGIFVEW